jgi:hypothetical protein
MFRNGIALSLGLDVIRAVAAGKGPRRVKFLSGYTGWAAGQLEAEIARGDWLVAPADRQTRNLYFLPLSIPSGRMRCDAPESLLNAPPVQSSVTAWPLLFRHSLNFSSLSDS